MEGKFRLAWATDTHFDFVADDVVESFAKELAQYDGCVITGDVSNFPNVERHLKILRSAGVPVWFVHGNHDAYGGSVAGLRSTLSREFSSGSVRWLGSSGPVMLTPGTALVGDDGWYDGRNGSFFRSTCELWDFHEIDELRVFNRQERLSRIKALADASADRVEALIAQAAAVAGVDHIVVATHVPPWEGAAWHLGKLSDRYYQPFFSSRSMGLAIEKAAGLTDKRFTVLCGHSHSEGVHRPSQQITCETGAAEYRRPSVHKVLWL